ncbi:MAG: hypothetical protein ACYDC8_02875 [Gammaproteobacteria bacterium]
MDPSPITVYLDSSDFSLLSDPRRRTDSLDQIRSTLLGLAKSKHVRFVFSGAHLIEMAPLDAKFTPASIARANLLVELCGRNAFISFDRLIACEIEKLANPSAEPLQALSCDATWFPEFEELFTPVKWADITREIDQEIKKHGLNRQQRRVIKRKLLNEHHTMPKIREMFSDSNNALDLNDILKLYPMRPQDAKVIGRYTLGQATVKEAEDAFLESLRDPRWMMQWFAAHHDKLTPVTEWLRGPSRNITAQMKEMASQAKELLSYETIFGSKFKVELFTSIGWQAEQDKFLLNMANRFLAQDHHLSGPCENVELVKRYCPGLSTTIRSLYSSLWNSIGNRPRTPLESDFIDATHAMYAPYVTFFRADRYMATQIRKHVGHLGTQVVSRLEELPDKIIDLIQSRKET